jgi:hypothetical protein
MSDSKNTIYKILARNLIICTCALNPNTSLDDNPSFMSKILLAVLFSGKHPISVGKKEYIYPGPA